MITSVIQLFLVLYMTLLIHVRRIKKSNKDQLKKKSSKD